MSKNTEIKSAKEKSLEAVATDLGIKIKTDGKTFVSCPNCGSGMGKNGTSACSINKSNNTWKCFSCDSGGSTIDLVMIKEKCDFSEALKMLTNNNGYYQSFVPDPPQSPNSLLKKIHSIKRNNKRKAIEYLERKRKIKVQQFNNNAFYYDSYSNSICFTDSEEQLLNLRGINNSSKKNAKGSKIKNALYIYGFKEEIDVVYLVESPTDALSSSVHSFLSIFSTSNKLNDTKKLGKYTKDKTVILAFDADPAGETCTEYYKSLFENKELNIKDLKKLILPAGKDVNDLCQEDVLDEFLKNKANYSILIDPDPDETISPIQKDSEDPNQDFAEYGFFKQDGCYYVKVFKGKSTILVKASNFTMEIMYHFIDGTNNTKRLIKIQRYTGEIKTLEVLSSEMKKEIFETILKSHNCTFVGAIYTLSSVFMQLMDHQKEAYAINTLGYNPEHDFYSFSDSIINNNNELVRINNIGILSDNNKNFYLPAYAQSNLENKTFTGDRKFRYKPGSLNFTNWSDLICKAYGVKGSIGICVLINALFRDIVFKELNFFPFLFLFGEAGVGKSSYIDFFLRPFGDKNIGVSIKTSTPKGIARTTSQRKNTITFLKEYDSTISRELIAFFKNAYDGAGYTIAQKSNDNKTESFFVECSLFIDANVLPTSESALYDRMIVLMFEKDKFSQAEKDAYEQLIDQSEQGLGQIVKEIISTRSYFKEQYKQTFREIYNELKDDSMQFQEIKLNSLPERTIKHIAFFTNSIQIAFQETRLPFQF